MPDARSIDVRALLANALLTLVVGCRADAGAPNGRETSARATGALSVASSNRAPVAPAPAAAASTAVPAASSSAAASENECGTAPSPSAPLPRLEQRSLAAHREGQYKFELKYPFLQVGNAKATPKVNRLFLERLTAIKKRFTDDAEGEGRPTDPDNARWFEGKCELAYSSAAFVSVGCDTMEGPGAHPNLDQFAYTFQICPEVRPIALADLCRAMPECRKRIVDLINEDFRTGDKKETGIQFRDRGEPEGKPSDADHPIARLESFGITPTGLRIFLFDELPHVLQAFAVVDIPATKLRPVMRDDMARLIWGL